MASFKFSINRLPKCLRNHKSFRKYAKEWNTGLEDMAMPEYLFAYSTARKIYECKCSNCKQPFWNHDRYDSYKCGLEDDDDY